MYPDPSTNISRFAIASPFQGLWKLLATLSQASVQRTVHFSTSASQGPRQARHRATKADQAKIAFVLIGTFLVLSTPLSVAQQQCHVANSSTLMPGDERLIDFHNCHSGIAANIYWLRDQDIPVVIPVLERRQRLDQHDWLILPASWLIKHIAHSSHTAYWRPTLDAPLDRETQARLRQIMAQHQAIDAAELDLLWDQRGKLALIEGTVKRVSKVGDRWFLNFSDDYRNDFTIGLQGLAARHTRTVHGRLSIFEGRRVRVIGIIQAYGGPYVAVSNGWQLQLVDAHENDDLPDH